MMNSFCTESLWLSVFIMQIHTEVHAVALLLATHDLQNINDAVMLFLSQC